MITIFDLGAPEDYQGLFLSIRFLLIVIDCDDLYCNYVDIN